MTRQEALPRLTWVNSKYLLAVIHMEMFSYPGKFQGKSQHHTSNPTPFSEVFVRLSVLDAMITWLTIDWEEGVSFAALPQIGTYLGVILFSSHPAPKHIDW